MTSSPSSPKPQGQNDFRFILIWLALALFLRWQVIEPRWIPSGSMLPTLQLQDKILIEKIRPKISRGVKGHLKHGNIVVFHPPKQLVDAGYEKKSALIKRLIGLPGDEIQIHNGELYRNGDLVKEFWRTDLIEYEMDSVTVPNGQLWVLGDNRNNSLDSHIWGALPEENVIGTAILRYWPIERFGPIRFPTPEKFGHEHLTTIRSMS